jgi:hypothetical protein
LGDFRKFPLSPYIGRITGKIDTIRKNDTAPYFHIFFKSMFSATAAKKSNLKGAMACAAACL